MKFWGKKEPIVERIEKLAISDNDILVFNTSGHVSQAQYEHIKKIIDETIAKHGIKNIHILILEDGMKIEAIIHPSLLPITGGIAPPRQIDPLL